MSELIELINKKKLYSIKVAVAALLAYVVFTMILTAAFPNVSQLFFNLGSLVLILAIRLLAESITTILVGQNKKSEMPGLTAGPLTDYILKKTMSEKQHAETLGIKFNTAMFAGFAFSLFLAFLEMTLTHIADYVRVIMLLTAVLAAGAGYCKGKTTVLSLVIEKNLIVSDNVG